MKFSILILLLLSACGEYYEPQPVECFNKHNLEVVDGIKIRQYEVGDTTYIEYNDRNGFRMTINKSNSKDWVCSDVKKAS